jgi:FkbM family methyltransferase
MSFVGRFLSRSKRWLGRGFPISSRLNERLLLQESMIRQCRDDIARLGLALGPDAILLRRLDAAIRAVQISEENVGYKLDLNLRATQSSEANVGHKLDILLSPSKSITNEIRDEIDRLDSYLSFHANRIFANLEATHRRLDGVIQGVGISEANVGGKLDRNLRAIQISEANVGDKLDGNLQAIGTSEANVGGKLDRNLRAIQISEANVGDKLDGNLRAIGTSEANVGDKLDMILQTTQSSEVTVGHKLDIFLSTVAHVSDAKSGPSPSDLSLLKLLETATTIDERIAYLVAVASGNEVRRKAYSPIPIENGDSIIVPSHDFDFIIPTTEVGLCAAMTRGVIDLMEVGVRAVIAANVRPGDFAIDAGANIGIHCVSMAASVGPTGKVLAFEPTPQLAAALAKTAVLNGFRQRVEVCQAAVGDRSGTAAFGILAHSPSNSLFANEATGAVEVQAVRIVTLDEIVPPGQVVNFVKMDIEGAEPLAWAGMKRVLRESRDIRVVLEWSSSHFKVSGFDPHTFASDIREEGFEIFEILETGASSDPLSFEGVSSLDSANVFLCRSSR